PRFNFKNLNESGNLLFWSVALTAFYGLAWLEELLPNHKLDGSK
ncbi:17004_t:CDS:1, partial [Dentiscutata erythropus]